MPRAWAGCEEMHSTGGCWLSAHSKHAETQCQDRTDRHHSQRPLQMSRRHAVHVGLQDFQAALGSSPHHNATPDARTCRLHSITLNLDAEDPTYATPHVYTLDTKTKTAHITKVCLYCCAHSHGGTHGECQMYYECVSVSICACALTHRHAQATACKVTRR